MLAGVDSICLPADFAGPIDRHRVMIGVGSGVSTGVSGANGVTAGNAENGANTATGATIAGERDEAAITPPFSVALRVSALGVSTTRSTYFRLGKQAKALKARKSETDRANDPP